MHARLRERRARERGRTCRLGRRTTRAAVVALLAAAAVSAPLAAQIEEVEKAPPPPRAPKAAPAPLEPEDRARLEALELRLKDWEAPAGKTLREGLEVAAKLIPDALAYKAAREYLRLRGEGQDHAGAVARLRGILPRLKRYRNRALIRLELRNPKFALREDARRIFTLDKPLHKEGVSLSDARRKRLSLALGSLPENLRVADLRIKRFWVTQDGATRRVRPPSDPDRKDPLSHGRKAFLSKPIRALVLEDKPAAVELLVSRSSLLRARFPLLLRLKNWKRYEGPFRKDTLDLNSGRTWAALKPPAFELRPPPSGLEIPAELQRLLVELEGASPQG